MEIFWIILGILLGALSATTVHRVSAMYSGRLLACIPATGFMWLLTRVPDIHDHPLQGSISWFPQLGADLSFHVDALGLLMALLITGIGAIILAYSGDYLKGDSQQGRFFVFLMVFMASMLGVVTADNLILLFVFWELTSVSSYLLIGYYHESAESRWKALQALLVTGLGGAAMMGGLILLNRASGTWTISEMLNSGLSIAEHAYYPAIVTLFIIGAFTKSAQFPFHFWLPNAMAAPTPVSAYLHSATMVKAGVFLLLRFTPVLGGTSAWMITLTGFGSITMLIGAVNGLRQTDLKKILAYTTLSVLGMLVLLIGLGTPTAIASAMLLLTGHALYKATLFLTSGIIDHETGTRDLQRLRGLRRAMPITAAIAGLAALSKAGLPPFFGFIGKESIYSIGFAPGAMVAILPMIMLANMIMFALALSTGFHPFHGAVTSDTPKSPHEAGPAMYLGPLILSVLGLVFGLLPGITVESLIGSAVTSILSTETDIHLSVWHGFNVPLLLSIATIAGGVVLYRMRVCFWSKADESDRRRLSFDRIYTFIFNGFVAVAKCQTRILQSGYLRNYFIIILSVTGAMIAFNLIALGGLPRTFNIRDAKILDWAACIIIMASLYPAIFGRSRMTVLIALGAVGFGVTMIFILHGAPDLAITQIVVETLTVVLFMLAIYRLPNFRSHSTRNMRFFDSVFSGIAGLLVTLCVLKAQHVKLAPSVSNQYSEWSYSLAHGKNIVNVILVDFRALDTMGEISVLAISSIGIMTLVLTRTRKRRMEKQE